MIDHLLLPFTGENDIPVIGFAFDRTGFHLTYRRMGFLACGEFDFDGPNLREADPVILSQRTARLWKREGCIAPISMKTRIAWCFPLFDPPEECLVCLVHAP